MHLRHNEISYKFHLRHNTRAEWTLRRKRSHRKRLRWRFATVCKWASEIRASEGRAGRPNHLWILKFSNYILSKKGCVVSFEKEKRNFTTFHPWKNHFDPLKKSSGKTHYWSPWKKSFRRPWSRMQNLCYWSKLILACERWARFSSLLLPVRSTKRNSRTFRDKENESKLSWGLLQNCMSVSFLASQPWTTELRQETG